MFRFAQRQVFFENIAYPRLCSLESRSLYKEKSNTKNLCCFLFGYFFFPKRRRQCRLPSSMFLSKSGFLPSPMILFYLLCCFLLGTFSFPKEKVQIQSKLINNTKLTNDLGFGEVLTDTADELIGFVSLAREQNDIAALGV